jgi:hypothetical protein
MEIITAHDREILRNLAKHKMELHNCEKNKQNLKDWFLHNTFNSKRPMIHIDISGCWQEIFPQRLKCEGALARNFEERLWESFYNYEFVGDDYPVTDFFPVRWHVKHIPFGIDVKVVNATNELGQSTLGYQI